MTHLTDEQFELILQGAQSESDHLADCRLCQKRLAERKALADRLRSAFASIEPDKGLAERIRHRIDVVPDQAEPGRVRSLLDFHAHWKGWTAAFSATAAVIVLVPLIMYFSTTSSASAAQAALVKIHEHNLSENHHFYSEADPEKLAAYLKGKLGFNLRLPQPGRGLALRGCCVRHFQDLIVGSYVVDTPEGVMSVVVVTDTPQMLGITGKFEFGGQTYYKSSFARMHMVSVRIGDYSYCAVGEISHQYLTDLLSRLLP